MKCTLMLCWSFGWSQQLYSILFSTYCAKVVRGKGTQDSVERGVLFLLLLKVSYFQNDFWDVFI